MFTTNYNPIYAVFVKAKKATDKKPFSFQRFAQASDQILSDVIILPSRAKYFTQVSELIYDSTLPLRANVEHILMENRSRFPASLIDNLMLPTLFTGAVELAKRRVEANYKVAVPTYYRNEICLLLPLSLINPQKTDLALAIKKYNGYYTAKTCLTLDMAYNDARLIARPDTDWLIP